MAKPLVCTGILLLIFQTSLVHADLLVWNDSGKHRHIFGKVVKQSEQGVLFRSRATLPTEGKWFSREEIAALVVTVDDVRLSQLNIENLYAYRDYAEELAGQSTDQQARDLAIRLFLIVAYWADQEIKIRGYPELRDSSIRNLISLARTESERLAFYKLAFLHQLTNVQKVDELREDPMEIEEETKKQLLELVKAVRTGDRERGTELWNRDVIKKAWNHWSDLCSWDDVGRMLEAGEPSSIQLERLLQIEVELLTNQATLPPTNRLGSWAVQSADYDVRADLLPTFSNITEFNPRRSKFLKGQWIEPQ